MTYKPNVSLVYDKGYLEELLLGDPYEAGRSVQRTIIGSPEGVAIGSPGDIRIQMDLPTLWIKAAGVGTRTGWVPLGDSGLAPLIALIQMQIAVLQSDVGALQVDVGVLQGQVAALNVSVAALAAAVTALQGDVGTLQTQVGVLQGQVGALQTAVAALAAATYLTTAPEPGLPNSSVLTAGTNITLTPGAGTLTVAAPTPAPSVLNVGTTLWEYDLANEANLVIAAGPISIDAATWGANAWVAQRPAGTGLFSFVNTVGLQYANDGAAGSTFAVGSQTAALVYLEISRIFNLFGLDARARILFQVQMTQQTYVGVGASTDCGVYGIAGQPGNGIVRVITASRTLGAGVDISQSKNTSGTSSAYTTAPGPTADVLSVQINGVGNCHSPMIGVWNGAFATTLLTPVQPSALAQTNTFNTLLHPLSRFVLAFPTNVTLGHTATARRIRFAYMGSG